MKEIIISNPTKKSVSFKENNGGWCHAFVYSQRGNFLIKGTRREVVTYIHNMKELGFKFFYNLTTFKDGESHNIWAWYKNDVILRCPGLYYSPDPKRPYNQPFKWCRKWVLMKEVDYDIKILKEFKRLPKRWIPEFNELAK